MPYRILIIADYSSKTGLGHMVRSLSIGQSLTSYGAEVTMAAPSFPDFLDFKFCRTITIPQSISFPLTLAELKNADAIILDSYLISDQFRPNLKLESKLLMYLDDDLGQTLEGADMLVNPSPFANVRSYSDRAPTCRFLLGPQYAPLSPQFRKSPLPWTSRPQRILVSFGGADLNKLTEKTVSMLIEVIPANVCVDVVLPTNLEIFSSQTDRVRFHKNVPNLSELMRKACLAVTQVGSTMGELAASGTPAVVAVVQDLHSKWLSSHSEIDWYLPVDGRASSDQTARRLAYAAKELWQSPELLSAMSQKARITVDGEGSIRITHELLALLEILKTKSKSFRVSGLDK